jgi:tetratricopeptide (TPR) repeat protein
MIKRKFFRIISDYHIILLVQIFFIICPFISFSQSQTDSLAKSRELFDSGEYKEAGKLLRLLYENNPDDLNINWLYAQSAYWSGKFNKSMLLYENAIEQHPENYYLKLDYGIKLVDIGEFAKALTLLEKYLAYDKHGADALIALSKMAYWKGNYNKAISEINKVLSKDPDNIKAKGLRDEIIMAKSPWIKLSSGVKQDDQPLFSLIPSLDFGFSKNAYINPLITFALPHFISEKNSYSSIDVLLSNNIKIIKYKASLFFEGGIYKLPTNEIIPQGGLKLSKTLLRYFDLELLAEHKPYLNTKANMTNPMKTVNYDFSLSFSGRRGWIARLGHRINDFYTENNKITSTGIWLVSSPLKIGKTESRLGYAYSYSDSEEDRFIPRRTVEEIIATGDFYSQIKGVYDPYFTPNDQSINSVIFMVKFNPVKNFELGLKSTFGFYATTQNPYFYLNRRGNRILFIQKDYYSDNYHPYEELIYFNWDISKKISLRTEYALTSTYFYKSHYGLITLNVMFWNEKASK